MSRGCGRLNPKSAKSAESLYAEISRTARWNFPSSSDEDEEEDKRTKPKKSLASKPKPVTTGTPGSSDDEVEQRPVIPPKICDLSSPSSELPLHSLGGAETGEENYGPDDVTIEYSALRQANVTRMGSLLGPEDTLQSRGSDDSSNTSIYEDSQDNLDLDSVTSDNSSKAIPDYEQSSTCVDMDQLSLDSAGKRPKRIVETHETHEIVPADNNDDDIVERIIETQTITEKLDDNRPFNDYTGEDYSKILENDDDFVSHIFTLGRTMEQGGAKKKKQKDFAFVENPFSVPEPVMESMPLEKKTVKQKITTLVKKKKANSEENLYDEVLPVSAPDGAAGRVQPLEEEEEEEDMDHYNHTNDRRGQGTSVWDNYEGGPSHDGRNNRVSNLSEDSQGMVYETFGTNVPNDKPQTAEKKKESKPEKKSLFKGFKKFLKKKDKYEETDKGGSLVLEDDYQEFVP